MTHVMHGRPVEILLVEDNPADIRLTREAIKEFKIHNTLHVITNGVEALAFLRREGGYADAARPDLVLLDLNLPKKNGLDVLKEIKTDEALQHIPVVILTASKADQDVLDAYYLHANCYITKPVGLAQFEKIVRSIEEFWFTIVALPQG
jgi:CheY-like chemotaxis protein